MRKSFSLLLFCVTGSVYANIGPSGFYDFPNCYFVETGTAGGNAIELARKTGHFTEIYSIDIHPPHVEFSKVKFLSEPHIHIQVGDSSRDLEAMIKPLNKPITFWLDAHRGEPGPQDEKNTPLLEELEQIKRHPIKTHTILIDDMHCCGTILFDYLTREQIAAKVLEINPNYAIEYVAGGDDGEYPNNIMVARVRPQSHREK